MATTDAPAQPIEMPARILELADDVANAMYEDFREMFTLDALDVDDLRQEARIAALHVYTKYAGSDTSMFSLGRMALKSVWWRMQTLLRRIHDRVVGLTEGRPMTGESLTTVQEPPDLRLWLFNRWLSMMCSRDERQLFKLRFEDNLTLDEVAQQLGWDHAPSRQYVNQLVKRLVAKLDRELRRQGIDIDASVWKMRRSGGANGNGHAKARRKRRRSTMRAVPGRRTRTQSTTTTTASFGGALR